MDSRRHFRGLHLVRKAGKAPSQFFRVGDEIPKSGVYRVLHAGHRVSHEALLLAGEKFPRCSQCQSDVHFELLRAVPQIANDENVIRVYEIPIPVRKIKNCLPEFSTNVQVVP
jgi:hypothetical protein